ncbi:MAG: tRNA guanosine(34) transglycosylase Tgt [Alphaproteobacteria bacterium]|jgi:queuine tRNA-ribosyltransferase|nr:tRNA guanosine(34) transglycosylase Tgt [Alphaproteobacteria bacterium]
MSAIPFVITARDGAARAGRLELAHGVVHTPAFMPVGTAATVKGVLPEAVAAAGAEILLGNVYHLMLRPGAGRINELGGLHKFMNWPHPILTDSGGFQIMSLAKIRKLDEDGVEFRAHTDGSRHRLTPAASIDIQRQLGSDISMVLDECTPYPVAEAEAARSMRCSMRWAALSRERFEERPGHALFGIVQGGVFADLRAESAASLSAIGFDGYAIGGLAVGEGEDHMLAVLDGLEGALPEDRPRYLMGVGRPGDMVKSVLRGVDMFDCVLPTRSGRTGRGYTARGAINLRNARHAADQRPLDGDCACGTCVNYSRAYLHHLFRCEEMLGPILLTLHNLGFYQTLMAGLRAAIAAGRLGDFAGQFLARAEAGDIEPL